MSLDAPTSTSSSTSLMVPSTLGNEQIILFVSCRCFIFSSFLFSPLSSSISFFLSLSLSLSISLSLSLFVTLSLSLYLPLYLSLSPSFFLSLSRCLSPFLSTSHCLAFLRSRVWNEAFRQHRSRTLISCKNYIFKTRFVKQINQPQFLKEMLRFTFASLRNSFQLF